jgi:multidrug efflux pump subunit AcrA (membrane-fusion protein)
MNVPRLPWGLAATGLGAVLVIVSAVWAQPPPTSAKIDTAPLELLAPDRYQIPAVLEPARHVTLVATSDGIVRSQDAKAGAVVREGQEVAQLDRVEASAKLKIAQAVVKELQAAHDEIKALATSSRLSRIQAEARLEAAQAHAELAQLEVDRCTLRAPFAGKLMDSRVSDGQYVDKGSVIADLADVSSLRAFIPVGRAGASVGGNLALNVEGQPVTGKIQALLPLPESFAALRELSMPLAAAWVVVPNSSGVFEPGQRVVSPVLPTLPIATVDSRALLKGDEKDGSQLVQVIRNEYVTNVKVRVLGNPGPDRVQLTGALRPTDTLIVSTSVPLLAGTLIRFGGSGSGKTEATTPNPADAGETADLTPPQAPGSAKRVVTKGKPSSKPAGYPGSSTAPATKAEGKSVPF